jgi:hypothetical protein
VRLVLTFPLLLPDYLGWNRNQRYIAHGSIMLQQNALKSTHKRQNYRVWRIYLGEMLRHVLKFKSSLFLSPGSDVKRSNTSFWKHWIIKDHSQNLRYALRAHKHNRTRVDNKNYWGSGLCPSSGMLICRIPDDGQNPEPQ